MGTAPTQPLEALKAKGFDVLFVSHAAAILAQDFPDAVAELEEARSDLELPITEIIGSGGGETKFTQRLRKTLTAKHWKKHNFEITKEVDGVPKESTSHEVDHVRRFDAVGVVAISLSVTWRTFGRRRPGKKLDGALLQRHCDDLAEARHPREEPLRKLPVHAPNAHP
ncbi:MAG: hypothetical protein WA210_24515 [Burkholderiaceae bacterium]